LKNLWYPTQTVILGVHWYYKNTSKRPSTGWLLVFIFYGTFRAIISTSYPFYFLIRGKKIVRILRFNLYLEQKKC
jgi:RsiW-degrading membrane proteinase PrsW (M82 family)